MLSQATVNVWGLVIAGVWLLTMSVLVWRSRPSPHQVWPLILMPVPWVVLAVWAGLNWAETGAEPRSGDGVDVLVLIQFAATLLVSGFAVFQLKTARLPALGLAVLNAWCAFICGLVSGMIVTGSWL